MRASQTAHRFTALLIAPYCDGDDVGEARSTYEWVRGVSEHIPTTVLSCYRPSRCPPSAQLPNCEVIEWPDMWLSGRCERLNAAAKPGYFVFYGRARRWIRRALDDGRTWSLAHQVCPLALRYPSPAAGLIRPFVWGPLAGSICTPPGFRHEMKAEPWYMHLRELDGLRLRCDPWLRASYSSAAVVVGVAPYVRIALESRGVSIRKFEVMSEVGIHGVSTQSGVKGDTGVVRLLYVGRIVRAKGVRDAIRAVARVNSSVRVHLDLVGDGSDRAACEHEVRSLGLGDCVTFHGRLPREEVDKFYQRADVFIFPSIREPSGNVVVEAMSYGLPVIAASNGGPAHMVTEECGIRIEPTQPDLFAGALSSGIQLLASNPSLRRSLGVAARQRVAATATWGHKIAWMLRLYDEVIAGAGDATSDAQLTNQSGQRLRTIGAGSIVPNPPCG